MATDGKITELDYQLTRFFSSGPPPATLPYHAESALAAITALGLLLKDEEVRETVEVALQCAHEDSVWGASGVGWSTGPTNPSTSWEHLASAFVDGANFQMDVVYHHDHGQLEEVKIVGN